MQNQSDVPTRSRSARHAVVRRSTRGPLNDEDPLSASQSPNLETSPISSPKLSSLQTSPRPSTSSSLLSPPPLTTTPALPRPRTPSPTRLDLSFLLRPTLYQSIPTTSILPPFLATAHQPPPGSTLAALVAGGYFRHAAIKAASDLCTGAIPAADHAAVLEAFHVRLACLLLAGHGGIAAAEARPLGDFVARAKAGGGSAGAGTLGVVPWGLRVLLLRLLQAGDGRKMVMGLYALGAECRGMVVGVEEEAEREVWRGRLLDLGVRVVAELLEMGEVEAAVRHLGTLQMGKGEEEAEEMRLRVALLYVRVGDVAAAERTLRQNGADHSRSEKVLNALVSFARGQHEEAAKAFRSLHEIDEGDVLVANNIAVCLLYTGRMGEAANILETLVSEARPTSSILFNLATMYELTTERAVEKKAKLVERVASKGPENGGWERAGAEFKL